MVGGGVGAASRGHRGAEDTRPLLRGRQRPAGVLQGGEGEYRHGQRDRGGQGAGEDDREGGDGVSVWHQRELPDHVRLHIQGA